MPKIRSILVIGSSGQLGQSLMSLSSGYQEYDFFFATRRDLDLTDMFSFRDFFDKNKFDLIINCAGFTDVDKAEEETTLASQVNYKAVKKLAENAIQQQIKLIHISTDYVYSGKQYRPYVEADTVEPLGVYGTTKLQGEEGVIATLPNNAVVIRTSWLYSEYGNNFVKTMLRLGQERDALSVVFDQIGTPTYAYDLAESIMKIVESERFNQATFKSEVYHYSNEGVCSWYDFAKVTFYLSNLSCDVSPIETHEYPTAAVRPYYSLLNKVKIKQHFNLTIPYWQDSLRKCLKKLQGNGV